MIKPRDYFKKVGIFEVNFRSLAFYKKSGFVYIGLIIAMTMIFTASLGLLSISNNSRKIANFKNQSRHYHYLTKSTHSYVYKKVLDYVHIALINTEIRMKNEFENNTTPENIEEMFLLGKDRFQIIFMEELYKNGGLDIRKYFSAMNFAQCSYEVNYLYRGYRGPFLVIVTAKYREDNIRKEHLVEYKINSPELDMNDFLSILKGEGSSFVEKHWSVVNVGSTYEGL